MVGGYQRYKILVNEQGRTEIEVSVVDMDPEQEKLLNIALIKSRAVGMTKRWPVCLPNYRPVDSAGGDAS